MSKLIHAIVAALCVTTSLLAHADDKPKVESFFSDPAVKFATLSPGGHYVAILTRTSDGGQALVVRDTADLTKMTVAATFDTARINEIRWINEKRLGFTVKNPRLDFVGNLDEFAVDRDGANIVHLISGSWHHEQAALGSNIKDKTLTADYGFFSQTEDGSDDIVVMRYTFNNLDRTVESSRLYRLNTRTRQLTDLLPAGQPARVRSWLLDADSRPRVALTEAKGRCGVWYRAGEDAQWSEISNRDCLNDVRFQPVFFDSRNTLYVRAGYMGRAALFQYDLAKRELAKEPFVDVDGFDYAGTVEQDHVARKIIGVHLQADAVGTVWLDPAMKAIQQKVDALLPGTSNFVTCGIDCASPPAVLVRARSDRMPTSFYVYTPANGKIVGLGATHPDIKAAQMGRREFYRFAARDGLQVPVYVTTPPGKPAAGLPAVLLVHGGPYVRGASWEWEDEAQFLASRGYVVLQPEFRGSTGFGYAHFKAGWKQWGRAMQDDLADTVRWAVAKGMVDPKRVAIMGASYGGYATLMGMIRDPELFRCGVEWAGVTDLDLLLTTIESDVSEDARRYNLQTLVGDPQADAAQLAEFSPLRRAAELKQPLLMAHGSEDVRVLVVHATRFRSAVADKNRNVEWISYPNEGHVWRNEATRIDFWKHVEAFLAKNL
jgi:dipeptidyl aminopeptidase/acylaminoacyl peptidase